MRILMLILVSSVTTASILPAVPLCRKGENVNQCIDRLEAQLKNQGNDQMQQRLLGNPTGAGTKAGTASSSIKDFLTPFSSLIQSASLDSTKQQLLITWNLAHSNAVDAQLQSIVHQPQLFGPLKDALTAASHASRVDSLQSSLNDLNDVEIVGSGGLELRLAGTQFGRRFDNYRPAFDALFGDLNVKARSPAAIEAYKKLLGQEDDLLPPGSPGPLVPSTITNSKVRESLEKDIANVAATRAAEDLAYEAGIKDYDLAFFSDLVANQPQLTASFSYHHRGSLVGPPQKDLEGSWEYSWTNVNRYYEYLDCLHKTAREGALSDWKRFVNGPPKEDSPNPECDALAGAKKGIKAASRATLTVQYSLIDRYSANIQPENVLLNLSKGHRFKGSLTWGRALLFDKEEAAIGRIDVLAEYDNYSDDPKNKDRLVASVTYTQKFSDSFSLPLGIAYANHADFLGEVQERFSAHFGLKLNVDWKTAAASSGSSGSGKQ